MFVDRSLLVGDHFLPGILFFLLEISIVHIFILAMTYNLGNSYRCVVFFVNLYLDSVKVIILFNKYRAVYYQLCIFKKTVRLIIVVNYAAR